MYAPVLVTPPAELPVTLDEAKLHLRVAFPEAGVFPETPEDSLITGLIQAAVSHIDGWTGILGRCLVEQTWRMDFDAFNRPLRLPLGPVIEIESITWRNSDGQIATIADSNYTLKNDRLGPYVYWDASYSFPGPLYADGAVSVTFRAGYPLEDVPPAIKVAILLMVGHWYVYRGTVSEGPMAEIPFAASALLAPFRRINV